MHGPDRAELGVFAILDFDDVVGEVLVLLVDPPPLLGLLEPRGLHLDLLRLQQHGEVLELVTLMLPEWTGHSYCLLISLSFFTCCS